MKPRVIHSTAFVEDAANIIAEAAQDAIEQRGIFRLSLCGGNTPRPVYEELAEMGSDFPWEKVQVTFGDERCVPPDDVQSNFRMASEALLNKVAIPEGNVFRMRGEIDPDLSASEYEAKLKAVAERFGEPRYVHDLLLLGIGGDGHTASLFPGTAALSETAKNVVANFVPKFSTHRITFTYPLINAARHVCFLVNDPKKAGVLDEILSGKFDYPSARVAPDSGRLTWLLGF